MADNLTVTAGSGTTIATDQALDGSHYQKIKLVDGTADSTTAIPGSAAFGLYADVRRIVGPTTGTVTSVSASASSVTLLASNSSRVDSYVYNDSTVALYVKLASSASTSSFTHKLLAGQSFSVPAGYTGIITGIWDSATGAARVTELT